MDLEEMELEEMELEEELEEPEEELEDIFEAKRPRSLIILYCVELRDGYAALRSGRRLNRLASDPGLSATPPEHHWTSPKGSGMA